MEMTKGKNGWNAKDVFPFDGAYKLTIETYRSPGNGLLSRASVSKHADGFTTHRFGLGSGGDFSKRMLISTNRCTEGNVTAQHKAALDMLEQITAEAKAHYAKYPITEEA